MSNVTLEEYLDFKTNYVDTFFPSRLDTWSSRVLLECIDNKELLEEIQNCIDDAVENIADGYPDIAESSLQDAAYLLYKIEDKD